MTSGSGSYNQLSIPNGPSFEIWADKKSYGVYKGKGESGETALAFKLPAPTGAKDGEFKIKSAKSGSGSYWELTSPSGDFYEIWHDDGKYGLYKDTGEGGTKLVGNLAKISTKSMKKSLPDDMRKALEADDFATLTREIPRVSREMGLTEAEFKLLLINEVNNK